MLNEIPEINNRRNATFLKNKNVLLATVRKTLDQIPDNEVKKLLETFINRPMTIACLEKTDADGQGVDANGEFMVVRSLVFSDKIGKESMLECIGMSGAKKFKTPVPLKEISENMRSHILK